MPVDLCMACMLMLVSMTLTLIQGHSGSFFLLLHGTLSHMGDNGIQQAVCQCVPSFTSTQLLKAEDERTKDETGNGEMTKPRKTNIQTFPLD